MDEIPYEDTEEIAKKLAKEYGISHVRENDSTRGIWQVKLHYH